jgi:hypothetical protein
MNSYAEADSARSKRGARLRPGRVALLYWPSPMTRFASIMTTRTSQLALVGVLVLVVDAFAPRD